MGRRGFKTKKPKGPKKVTYRLIDKATETGKRLYALLEDLVDTFHGELSEARVALAWHVGWRSDTDGRKTLGKARKVGELDREMTGFDLIVILSESFVLDPSVSEAQRRALIDHELCHFALRYDKNDEPELDAKGRKLYRLVKHDLEEFAAVAERHGVWKRDLETFDQALRRGKQMTLPVEEPAKPGAKPGKAMPRTIPPGGEAVIQ
jgi:hypothetical protein